MDMVEFTSRGALLGHIHNFGYTEDPTAATVEVKGSYPDMLKEINLIAHNFATEFNAVHQQGWNLDEVRARTADDPKGSFFDPDSIADLQNAAKNIKISSDVEGRPDKIAAALPTGDIAYSGNGGNALALARVKDTNLDFDGQLTSVSNYYQGVIGNMGVKTSEASRQGSNNLILLDSIQRNRESVSSVSLDEEMTNMIKFQQAFNAASRTINSVDEMLDKIINGMGLVGR